MKVSLAWIAVGILIGVIFFFTCQGVSIYEQFRVKPVEGFQSESEIDLHITTCPADTVSFVDGGGRTVCCEGTVANGKCSGKTVCSLSESIAGLPTCSAWLDAYLDMKSAERCPPSMPKYYENKATNTSGCTSGNRNSAGTAPANDKSRFCTLYSSADDDLLKNDSCTNQKFFENTKCFTRGIDGLTKQFINWGQMPPPIYCASIAPGSLVPTNCIDDKSFIRTVDYYVKRYYPSFMNWKEQSVSWGAQWKLNFCSAVQKVSLDKTMSMSELESYKLF